jgi:hypothetical protein
VKRLLLLVACGTAALVAVGAGGATTAGCTAAQLAGTFTVVPGSAGAGNIVYVLRLRNRSATECFVTGLVGMRLYGKTGRALPTHVVFAGRPGMLTAVIVRLKPGAYASSTARFTPDVPGPGEPVSGTRCEPTANSVSVSVPPRDAGTVKAAVKPPTPVCVHGALQVSVLVAGRNGPRP